MKTMVYTKEQRERATREGLVLVKFERDGRHMKKPHYQIWGCLPGEDADKVFAEIVKLMRKEPNAK